MLFVFVFKYVNSCFLKCKGGELTGGGGNILKRCRGRWRVGLRLKERKRKRNKQKYQRKKWIIKCATRREKPKPGRESHVCPHFFQSKKSV